jgi:hypothetical protein
LNLKRSHLIHLERLLKRADRILDTAKRVKYLLGDLVVHGQTGKASISWHRLLLGCLVNLHEGGFSDFLLNWLLWDFALSRVRARIHRVVQSVEQLGSLLVNDV